MSLLDFKGSQWTREKILFVALGIRLTLVLYSHIHDYIFKVNFTDIDYHVFTDAARLVAEGKNPFERATYRYTPVLAWFLVPNVKWIDFGKFLFCICDVGTGWLLLKILDGRTNYNNLSAENCKTVELSNTAAVVVFWLANPFTAIISARGNADVLVCGAVLLVLHILLNHPSTWIIAALVHGVLAIHLKIYPLIYLPSIFLYLASMPQGVNFLQKIQYLLLNTRGYAFVLISLLSFSGIVALLYNMYGNIFLEEFLLYHIRRSDIRHNFSPYFLPMYLLKDDPELSRIMSLCAFIPQALSVIYFAFRYSSDLPFCWFVTTFAFVALNKVCTSQYFVWYIVLLPVIVQSIELSIVETIRLVTAWLIGQGLWLLFAYLFEFQGWNTLLMIWISSLIFFAINCYILRVLLRKYKPVKTKAE